MGGKNANKIIDACIDLERRVGILMGIFIDKNGTNEEVFNNSHCLKVNKKREDEDKRVNISKWKTRNCKKTETAYTL